MTTEIMNTLHSPTAPLRSVHRAFLDALQALRTPEGEPSVIFTDTGDGSFVSFAEGACFADVIIMCEYLRKAVYRAVNESVEVELPFDGLFSQIAERVANDDLFVEVGKVLSLLSIVQADTVHIRGWIDRATDENGNTFFDYPVNGGADGFDLVMACTHLVLILQSLFEEYCSKSFVSIGRVVNGHWQNAEQATPATML